MNRSSSEKYTYFGPISIHWSKFLAYSHFAKMSISCVPSQHGAEVDRQACTHGQQAPRPAASEQRQPTDAGDRTGVRSLSRKTQQETYHLKHRLESVRVQLRE